MFGSLGKPCALFSSVSILRAVSGSRVTLALIFPLALLSISASPYGAAQPGNRAKNPDACCSVTVIDARTGIVTARMNADGRGFAFKVTDGKLLAMLQVGQAVFANFSTRQVSIDGKTVCCQIVSMENTPVNQKPPMQPSQTSKAPQPNEAAENKQKPGTDKRTDAVKTALGMQGPAVQPAGPTTGHIAIPATTAGVALTPTTPGSPPSTTSLVASPQLANFGCLPNQIASGTPIHCTVGLNGTVPGGPRSTTAVGSSNQPVAVQITTKPAASTVPVIVVVSPGSNNASINIPTLPDAPGGWVAIYASYQGATLSSAVNLIPSAIRDVKCFDGASGLDDPSIQGMDTCTITPWSQRPYGVIVHPTRLSGQTITIPLSEPGRLHHASSTGSVVIIGNRAYGGVWYPSNYGGTVKSCSQGGSLCDYFEPVPKTENHTVTVRDPSSGVTHSVTFKVLPASIRGTGFGDSVVTAQNPITVPSQLGQNLTVWVSFNAPPAPTDWNSQNAWLDVVYGGSSDPSRGSVVVQGPTNLGIKEQQCGLASGGLFSTATYCDWHIDRPGFNLFSFQVTVGACSQAENPNGCQATVTVSSNQALGRVVATINVTPE